MDRLGSSSTAIGVYFLVAAALGAGLSPVVGALADRAGGAAVLRSGLVLTAVVTSALPFVNVPIVVGVGLVLQLGVADVLVSVPTLVLVSRAAERVGRPTVPPAFVACVYAVFETVGAAAAPAIAQVAAALPYGLVAVAAGFCLVLRPERRR